MTTLTPDPEEEENSEELERRRKDLHLHRRMYGVMKGLTAQALYMALLAVICLHGNVHESFLQNEAVRNQIGVSELQVSLWR